MKPVVIVGGGITGLAAAWQLQQQGLEYIVLESSDRLGGKIVTERVDGFVIEGAADSFLTQKPWAWQLCNEIGLADHLIGTNDEQRKVYILRDAKLQLMPTGMRLIVPYDPDGLLQSELLSDEGKRRMLAETEIERRLDSEADESLASFVRRRFGQEALDIFGGPLLAGIYVGDPETLSMQATFPNYLSLEKKYGSLITGTREATPSLVNDVPKTAFVSLKSGMYELIEALEARLSGQIWKNCEVSSLEDDAVLHLTNGQIIEASRVILTLGAHQAAKLLQKTATDLSAKLKSLKTISSATVSLGFEAQDVERPLDGFGFVVAPQEASHLHACTWNSTKLAGRAPDGKVLMRVFVGGHRHEKDAFLPDDELIALAQYELKSLLGLKGKPVISRVFRWHDANTQYEVGHIERIKDFRAACPAWLYLTGSAYEGIGIPDCVRQGREIARQVAAEM